MLIMQIYILTHCYWFTIKAVGTNKNILTNQVLFLLFSGKLYFHPGKTLGWKCRHEILK